MKTLCVVAGLCIAMPAIASDAPTFRGNVAHTGVYDGPAVTQFNKVKWKFHTGGYVISSPAVVGGTAYVGSTDGNLYAVDVETGALKWKFATEARVVSSPAVVGDAVYFGSYDGKFYAVDAASGQLKWKFQTGGERRFTAKHLHGSRPEMETMPDPFDCYLSSPSVSNGTVYFGSGDGNVYALEAGSGKLKWKFQTGDVVHASPAIADGTVFIGSWDSYFYALDSASGKEKWRFKTGEDAETHNQVGIQGSAAVVDGVVYFGCRDSNFYSIDARTGQKKWAINNKGSWVITSPIVSEGKVYFATSDSHLFYKADGKTGAVEGSFSFTWPTFSSPALAGDLIYVAGEDGKLRAIDRKTMKLAWEWQTDASREKLEANSKVDGSANYEAAFKEDFYEAMVVGVNKLYEVGTILSSPVVVNRVIFVGSMDGNLYALM